MKGLAGGGSISRRFRRGTPGWPGASSMKETKVSPVNVLPPAVTVPTTGKMPAIATAGTGTGTLSTVLVPQGPGLNATDPVMGGPPPGTRMVTVAVAAPRVVHPGGLQL